MSARNAAVAFDFFTNHCLMRAAAMLCLKACVVLVHLIFGPHFLNKNFLIKERVFSFWSCNFKL